MYYIYIYICINVSICIHTDVYVDLSLYVTRMGNAVEKLHWKKNCSGKSYISF